MTALTTFFKTSETSLGVFYPTGYIIAIFPTFTASEKAAQALRGSGFSEDEVMALPATEILKFFEEFRYRAGLWSGVMTMLSRAFGTEQVFADNDVEHARAGAGFLAVYAPLETDKSRVQALVTPFEPVAMHWYESGGVESLV